MLPEVQMDVQVSSRTVRYSRGDATVRTGRFDELGAKQRLEKRDCPETYRKIHALGH